MSERTQIAAKFILTHLLILPVIIGLSLFFELNGYLLLSVSQTILAILFLSGYWEFIGIRLKWIYCLGVEFLILGILVYIFLNGTQETPRILTLVIFTLLQMFLLITLTKMILVIFRDVKERIEIAFPFHQGTYLITDGGNSKWSRLMNYHFHSVVHKKRGTNQSMLYATDVVKRTDGKLKILPKQNEDYPIFNEKVYSPMEGVVFKIVNDIDDNIPFAGNYPYNTGNTVVIKNNKSYFLLGHLKKGSIVVREGEFVPRNTFIAEAGNSGMSERPHLHMQLMKSETDDYWKGTGICIQYKNKNLYKNRLVNV